MRKYLIAGLTVAALSAPALAQVLSPAKAKTAGEAYAKALFAEAQCGRAISDRQTLSVATSRGGDTAQVAANAMNDRLRNVTKKSGKAAACSIALS